MHSSADSSVLKLPACHTRAMYLMCRHAAMIWFCIYSCGAEAAVVQCCMLHARPAVAARGCRQAKALFVGHSSQAAGAAC